MNFALRSPCKKCPFRTDVRPYLTVGRVEEICDGLLVGQATFSCHKTVRFEARDGMSHRVPHKDEEHCAGALIMLEHMERPNQMMRIAERLGAYDRTRLRMDSPVFTDANAMIEAFKRENACEKQSSPR